MGGIPTGPDETPTFIFNPLKEDFTHNFAGEPYTIPSREIKEFPKWLADHLAKHLIQRLASEDGVRIHYEDKIKKWHEAVYVQI